MLLFTGTSFTLIAGWVLSLAGASGASHLLWALGGIAGLIPSIRWLVVSIREKQFGSDFLALLTIVATLASAEYLASAVIALMLATGRLLELWATNRADRELDQLLSRVPRKTHRLNADGSLTPIEITEISIGMQIVVKSGEITPADGVLTTRATLDQSALTGEPLPVECEISATIMSGVLNAGQNLTMIVGELPSKSTYAGIIELVKSAQKNYSENIRLANRYALFFIPLVLGVVAITYFITGEIARSVAILVVATPCPLILAVPIAIVSGMSTAAKHGVIVRSGAALEKLATATTLLIDKTGTLTAGGPEVIQIFCKEGYSQELILQLAASLDQHSPHIVAKAIVAAADKARIKLELANAVHEDHGSGITGTVLDQNIYVGKIRGSLPDWVPTQTGLYIGVEIDQELVGIIHCADPIRPDAKWALAEIIREGITRVVLVTGDTAEGSQEILRELPISTPYFSLAPQDKLNVVMEEMKRSKGSVILIGDGINDSPAFAAVDVGIAMGGSGATAASEAADIVIVESSLTRIVGVLKIAKLTVRRAIQAAILGMGLCTIAMGIAALGLITASEGAFLQEIIDLLSILWSLTILSAYRGKRFDQSILSNR